MRRWLITILIFLLAGAVMNVAVAWGCALWPRVGNEELIEPVPPSVLAWFQSNSPVDVELPGSSEVRQRRGLGLKLRRMSDWIRASGQIVYVVSWRATAGLPFRCLDGAMWDVYDGDTDTQLRSKTFALEVPEEVGPFRVWTIHYGGVIPLRPIWPAFAFNTVFYATILWLLITVPLVFRRSVRRRRGLCVACGYPLGDSSVCTECGRAVPGSAVV